MKNGIIIAPENLRHAIDHEAPILSITAIAATTEAALQWLTGAGRGIHLAYFRAYDLYFLANSDDVGSPPKTKREAGDEAAEWRKFAFDAFDLERAGKRPYEGSWDMNLPNELLHPFSREKSKTTRHNQLKNAIKQYLAKIDIAKVIIQYDGYADSGQLEAVDFLNAENQIVDCGSHTVDLLTKDLQTYKPATLNDAILLMVLQLLEDHQPGWEDGEGSFGTATHDVASGKTQFAHAERFIATKETTITA